MVDKEAGAGKANGVGQATGYFATPISQEVTGEIKLADELFEFIIKMQQDPASRKSDSPQSAHPDLFESRFDFLKWPYPVVKRLKDLMFDRLSHVINQTSGFGGEQLSQLLIHQDSWFHIVRDGGYFQSHTHPLASWSMIFCVDPGDDVPENEFSAGKILISDPRGNASMFLDPVNRDMLREYSFNGIKFRPKKTELIIFPSYVQHGVEPYIGKRQRITVAANFWFTLKA